MDPTTLGGRGAGGRAHRPRRQGAGAADRRRLGRGGAGRARAGDADAQRRPGDRGGQAADRPPRRQSPSAGRALEAAHEPLRRQAVAWLAAEYDKDPAARDQLRQALESRYQAVREAAALELATKKDPAAFDALVGLLKAAGDPNPQRRVIEALVTLGDPRAAGAFLDRVEDDPGGTALADELLAAVGRFRRPEVADRLLALLDKDRKRRDAAVDALLTISGYDQRIDDPEDERPDRTLGGEAVPAARRRPGPPDGSPLGPGRRPAPAPAAPGGALVAGQGGRSRPGRAGQPPRRHGPSEGGRGAGLAAPEARGRRRAAPQGAPAPGPDHPVPRRRGAGEGRPRRGAERAAGEHRLRGRPGLRRRAVLALGELGRRAGRSTRC